jgi:hypothetical protein
MAGRLCNDARHGEAFLGRVRRAEGYQGIGEQREEVRIEAIGRIERELEQIGRMRRLIEENRALLRKHGFTIDYNMTSDVLDGYESRLRAIEGRHTMTLTAARDFLRAREGI